VSSYGHETAARNPQGEVLWHWGLGVRKYISLPTDLVRQNTGPTLGNTYGGWICHGDGKLYPVAWSITRRTGGGQIAAPVRL